MTTRFLDRILPFAKAAGPKFRAAAPMALGAVLVLVAARWVYVEFFEEARQTYGYVVVDSPEIYTRERLVNDRFVEDAWLRRKLRDTGKADFTPTGSVASRNTSGVQVALNQESGAGGGEAAPTSRDVARRDPNAVFRSELAYRSDIRNLIIENQLDDRHDLRGNSLYRLKFDASILPGDNTSANALISVTLEEPRHQRLGEKDHLFTAFDPNELKRWRSLFSEWLLDIDENINQLMSDLRYDYETHRLPRDYLYEMFATMQECDNYDRDFYRDTVKPILDEQETATPRVIKTHIETLRENLLGCNASTRGTDRLSGAIADFKGEEPPANAMAAASEGQPEGSAAATEDSAADAASESQIRRVSQPRRRAVAGDTKTGRVSVNEMINRFAAPRLFQLIFGRGTAGGKASGNIGVWNFFGDYAEVIAFYKNDDSPFQLKPKQTTFSAYNTNPDTGAFCGAGTLMPWQSDNSLSPWPDERTFCISMVAGTTDEFLQSFSITADEFSTILSQDQNYKYKIEQMIGQRGNPIPIIIETGLFHFIRDLQQSDSVFSYAVTPKQTVQSLVVDDQTSRRGTVAASANGIGGQLGGDRGLAFSGVREQPLVVGYGNALSGGKTEQGSANIEFGWYISPPVLGADNTGLHKAHAAAQYALTALVSVPAWWDQIDLRVERSWVDQEGNKRPVTSPNDSGMPEDTTVTIDLPRDPESISTSLFRHSAGPEVDEARMAEIVLTACRPGAILLPGRRLWRSAVVTLGAQTADEIHVLPNMHGIIAKFDRVNMPSGWTKTYTPYEVPITIWTSEGSRTLRDRARITMPSIGAADDGGKGILHPNGTCVYDPRVGEQASAG